MVVDITGGALSPAETAIHEQYQEANPSGDYFDPLPAADALAAAGYVRESELRELIATEIEAEAPDWDYADGVARDAHLRIADRVRRGGKP